MEMKFDFKAAADTAVALFTQFGLEVLGAVRPHWPNANYRQGVFDTNRLIREAFGEAGFAAPAQVHVFRNA